MGTRPDRGLGDGPQRVSDEELKDVFLRGEGEVRGGVRVLLGGWSCRTQRTEAGQPGPHRGQSRLFKNLAARPAQGSVSVRVHQAGPSGGHARALLCVCTWGACAPHQRSPQLPQTAGQRGGVPPGRSSECGPRHRLGNGWLSCCGSLDPGALCGHVASVPSTSPGHVPSATAQRPQATCTTVPSGGDLATVDPHGPSPRSPDFGDPGCSGRGL